MGFLGPRLVIAGTHSGAGKTTVATGLMAALTAAGHRVGSAKVGPDFIDPGYHSLATGRPSRTLDIWMNGADSIAPLAARAGEGCDITIVEGVMGLFDGAADGTPSSTAEVAVALDAPVVLVVDVSSMAQSVAAIVHGFSQLDPRVHVAGVVLNRVASDSHEQMLRNALAPTGIAVVGVLRRDDRLIWRDRHLGLVPVVERDAAITTSLDMLASLIAQRFDLDRVMQLASAAPTRSAGELPAPTRQHHARIAVAGGAAFSFTYPDNLDALTAAGAELVTFDPCTNNALPDKIDGLVIGGGFPEVYTTELGANTALLADVRNRVGAGLPTWAECGGLLWLCRSLDNTAMAGVIDANGTMTKRLTLGYRTAVTQTATFFGPAGTELRGHEYHYSTTDPLGGALEVTGRTGTYLTGFATPTLFATYLHMHLAARPDLAESFVATCATATPGLVGSPERR